VLAPSGVYQPTYLQGAKQYGDANQQSPPNAKVMNWGGGYIFTVYLRRSTAEGGQATTLEERHGKRLLHLVAAAA
jgi:hypothetical protein